MAVEKLEQIAGDANTWVGSPGRQKFLTMPVFVLDGQTYCVPGYASGSRGQSFPHIGAGKPVYVEIVDGAPIRASLYHDTPTGCWWPVRSVQVRRGRY